MNKLLVPFDFSVYATNALEYAIGLASQTEAEITVFHSFEMAVSAPAGEDLGPTLTYKQAIIGEEKENITKKIEDLLQAYKDKFYLGTNKQIILDVIVRSGRFEESLKRHLSHKPYNLIIMGTEGAFGWEEVFGGSHTSHIAENTNTNLLVIPIEAYYKGIKQIVYATNFDDLDISALSDLQDFNEFFEARITCLHISDKSKNVVTDQNKLEQLETTFSTSKQHIQFALLLDEDVEESIFNYARKTQADLLTILPQDHGVIGSIFHDSLTKNMSMHTDLPLLIMKK